MTSPRRPWPLAPLLALTLTLGACDWLYEVDRPTGPRGAERDDPAGSGAEPADDRQAAAVTGALPTEPPEERVTLMQGAEQAPLEPAAEPEVEPATEEETAPGEPERDLSAELRAMIGDPAPCLGDVPREVTEISIRVRATTTGTGVVTRRAVTGAHLPEPARECLDGRLAGARFESPVPGAPRDVTAELTVRRPPAREDEPEEGQQPTGTWRYGIFYPGGTFSEREADE